MRQEFLAEIKQVKATKTASSDIEIRLTVATDDNQVLDLGKLPAKTAVRVTIDEVPQKAIPSFDYE
jgi:hypothetical protein